jgi:hypothetical protein
MLPHIDSSTYREEYLLDMDDIIVPASTIQECLQRLENVFNRLFKAETETISVYFSRKV